MNAPSRLALPGDGLVRIRLRPSRTALGAACGASWLLVQSSLLPTLGIAQLPFDPIVPLLVAWCLSSRRAEAVWLAIGLGFLADSLSGAASSRLLMRYLLVVMLASPAQGHIVLRDRWMPTLGVAVICVISGFFVYLFPALIGAELVSDLRSLPSEVVAASLGSVLLWPVLMRLAGLPGPRASGFGRGR